METIVVVAVVAVWAAVIVPPLLRSRTENRPNSSVHDFRRQLSTLQRTVPTRTMVPMRGMARPLTQAPQATRSHGQPGQARRMHGHATDHLHTATLDRGAGAPHHRQTHLHRVSQRELVRRRRANVLFMLVVAVAISGFLAATTHAGAMVYAFAFSFIATCAYCYKLAQLRAYELNRQHADLNRYYSV